MSLQRKPLERRTYSQDRYYALIKRQKAGKATFKELTELDEIVNRVPDIREQVIRESFMIDNPGDMDDPGKEDNAQLQKVHHLSVWNRIKTFISRAFTTQFSAQKMDNPAILRMM
jgi:hypothetical protein